QDHERDQESTDHTFMNQAFDRLADVNRLVHDQVQVDVVPLRLEHLDHVRDGVPDAIDDRQAAGSLLPIDRHVNLPPAIDAHQGRLNRVGVLYPADIAQVNVLSGLDTNGDVAEFLDLVDHGIGVELELIAAEFGDAGRHHDVGAAQGAHDVQ